MNIINMSILKTACNIVKSSPRSGGAKTVFQQESSFSGGGVGKSVLILVGFSVITFTGK
ncbi:hypothetical protein GUI04_08275 [Xanthomonas citri pv. citri]|nr:hypothetical protein [Xanthomonas citri pv. citri]